MKAAKARLATTLILALATLSVGKAASEEKDGAFIIWKEGVGVLTDSNRLSQSFKSYLEAPQVKSEELQARLKMIRETSGLLGAAVCSSESLGKAYGLLQQLSEDPLDEGRCKSILEAVFHSSGELSRKQNSGNSADRLRKELDLLTWNMNVDKMVEARSLPPVGTNVRKPTVAATPSASELRLAKVRDEIDQLKLGEEVNAMQSRLEFQQLVVHLFDQGDYREAILGARFYRAMYGDLTAPLRLGSDVQEELAPSGIPATMGHVESISSRVLSILHDGIEETRAFANNGMIDLAAKHLQSLYAYSSRSPEILTFPLDAKRKMLQRIGEQEDLHHFMDSKDYGKASALLKKMTAEFSDFDGSEFQSSIDGALSLSALHLRAAQDAENSGNESMMKAELRTAADLWPNNPDLFSVTSDLTLRAEARRQAESDFDRLFAAWDIETMESQYVRFEMSFSADPARLMKLSEAHLSYSRWHDAGQKIKQLKAAKNLVGAWEAAEKTHQLYPEDAAIKQLALTQAAEVEPLVHGIKESALLAQRQPASALAHALTLRRDYPQSEFVEKQVLRLSAQLLGLSER
jgi:hypothetical protein